MKIFASIFLLFLFGCNSKAQINKAKLDSIFQLALKADSIDDYKTSILYYNQMLDIDSLNVEALVNRGRALIATSKIQEGFVDLNKAIKYYPHERTYFARGGAYLCLNNLDSAELDLKIITTKLNALFTDADYALSLLYFKKGDYLQALTYCGLGDKFGKNVKLSDAIKTEMREKLSNDIVNNFNYDTIMQTIRNLPSVKKADEKSLGKNKYGFTYGLEMKKENNWLYIIDVHDGEKDKTRWIFKMDAATLKVLNLP